MTVQFEAALAGDADVLIAMARVFHDEDGHMLGHDGEAAIRNALDGEPAARVFVARDGGKTLGYVVVTTGYSIEYGGRDGFIDDFYVVPAARGRGIGRAMLAFAIREAARLGIRTLHLEVMPGNDPADRLYRSAGFEETGRRLMRLPLDSPNLGK